MEQDDHAKYQLNDPRDPRARKGYRQIALIGKITHKRPRQPVYRLYGGVSNHTSPFAEQWGGVLPGR